jgi:hypothetical protein
MFCTDDINLLADNTNSIRRNKEALLTGAEVNAEKIKYFQLFHPREHDKFTASK